jgi:gas vesicle protein
LKAGPSPRRRGALAVLITTVLAGALLLGGAQAASAAPQLLAPGNGKTLRRGAQPTFKVRDNSSNARRYDIFMTIAAKKRTNRHGELKRTRVGTFARMESNGKGGWTYKAPAYTFPTWFMERPGTYYWQAFHIDCSVPGCHVVSRIRSFKVE